VEPVKLLCLLRSWAHSYEEDSNGVTVYRPVGFHFPLSRGRDGIEFRPDGAVIHQVPGRDDRGSVVMGSWKNLEGEVLELRRGEDGAPRRMTVIVCNQDVLRIRWD